ncbi:hypothetical protein EDC04DRAFT_3098926 [Pisolithus marmoratus]|nr:hypothetical protein EDC04DRAFT_3098926 [Pisolithus marmoratus]
MAVSVSSMAMAACHFSGHKSWSTFCMVSLQSLSGEVSPCTEGQVSCLLADVGLYGACTMWHVFVSAFFFVISIWQLNGPFPTEGVYTAWHNIAFSLVPGSVSTIWLTTTAYTVLPHPTVTWSGTLVVEDMRVNFTISAAIGAW